MSVAAILELFPQLAPHLKQTAGTLSGGEQQMVAIARALPDQQAELRRLQYKSDARSAVFSPDLLAKAFREEL